MTGMDMSDDGPSSLLQESHETTRGFLSIAAALRGPDDHPGDLGRTGGGTASGQCRLHCPCHHAGSTHAHHPVAPHLVTSR